MQRERRDLNYSLLRSSSTMRAPPLCPQPVLIRRWYESGSRATVFYGSSPRSLRFPDWVRVRDCPQWNERTNQKASLPSKRKLFMDSLFFVFFTSFTSLRLFPSIAYSHTFFSSPSFPSCHTSTFTLNYVKPHLPQTQKKRGTNLLLRHTTPLTQSQTTSHPHHAFTLTPFLSPFTPLFVRPPSLFPLV